VKPRIFIGSSSEGLAIAYALQSNLEGDGEVTAWTQDVFRPSEFVLDSLLRQLDAADVGVFVFSPDDTIVIHNVEQPTVRDNVIFEVGLYVGRLGRERCFMVAPSNSNPRLPSDLLGVTVVSYDSTRSDGRLEAALGPASGKIRLALKALTPALPRLPPELRVPVLERKALLSSQQRDILELIETRTPIAKTALCLLRPDLPKPELHYRLQQLRLLQFITMCDNAGNETLELHPNYDFARRGKQQLVTM